LTGKRGIASILCTPCRLCRQLSDKVHVDPFLNGFLPKYLIYPNAIGFKYKNACYTAILVRFSDLDLFARIRIAWIIHKSICRSGILPLLPEMRQDAASTLFMNNQG
jgi:hypothetical protein